MSEVRTWLLVAIAVFLAIFAAQNTSPSLPLVFLGMRSVALPLSAWVILAIAAGVVTSLLISVLFKLSNYRLEQELAARRRAMPPQVPSESSPQWGAASASRESSYVESTSAGARDWRESDLESAVYSEPARDRVSAEYRGDVAEPARPRAIADYPDNYSEPEEDEEFYEEWEEEERSEQTAGGSRTVIQDTSRTVIQNAPTYETKQEPTSSSWSGTMYSYTYRPADESEPETTPETTESVEDAEYRVIEPPVRDIAAEPPIRDIAPEQPEDDWGKKKKKKTDWE